MPTISQTDKIFAALLIGFVIYITVRGQLPAYLQLFTAGDASPPPQQSSSRSNDILGSLAKLASSAGTDFLSSAGPSLADAGTALSAALPFIGL